MNNTVYDDVKWVLQLIIPAFATVYFLFDAFLGLPETTSVLGICAVLAFLLEIVIYFGNRGYKSYGGDIVITKNALNKKTFVLELNTDPEELENMDAVIFKVKTTEEI